MNEFKFLLRHTSIIPSALAMGVFFNIEQLSVESILGTVLLGYFVTYAVAKWYPMPNRKLHVLSANAIFSMALSLWLFIKDIIQPFPSVVEWPNVILLSISLMLAFLVIFSILTWLHNYLDKILCNKLHIAGEAAVG